MEYPTYILPKDVLWLWCVVVGFIGVFSEEKNVLRFEGKCKVFLLQHEKLVEGTDKLRPIPNQPSIWLTVSIDM